MFESTDNNTRSDWFRTGGLGLLAGLLNGLIALGGGVLITPMLVASGISPRVAVGTSLAAVTMLSTIGFTAHLLLEGIPLGTLPIAVSVVGGVIGTVIGSKLLARMTPHWMLLWLAALQILIAIRLIDQGLGITGLGDTFHAATPPQWAYLGFGLFAGTMSAIFGVGGGALVLLGLAAFYGVPIAEGLAIALALNVTNALAGLVTHARAGRVRWGKVTRLIPGAILGIGLGAALAHALPVDAMRVMFGVFFLILGTSIARKGWAAARN
ncbi:MAG: sulfite exporter TauE/SafE family protein [Pseudomonadota bacterium]